MPTFVDPNACNACEGEPKPYCLEPDPLTLRAEVLEVVQKCSKQYGFGSPFVDETYLEKRTPVMSMPVQESANCTCNHQH